MYVLLRMGLFGADHRLGEGPVMMKFDIVIPYLKKIQKVYKSCDKPLEFC